MIKYVGLDKITVRVWIVLRHIYIYIYICCCDVDVLEIKKYGRSHVVSLGLLSACN